ncbi:MAG: DUF5723 family protein [Chitinophagaceae bacterium]
MKPYFYHIFLFFSVSTLLICFVEKSSAQDYLGLSSGNYAGIAGVSLQPASIADSRLKWDLNLFSIDVNYNNNFFYVKKDAILNNEFFKSPYNQDFNAVKQDLLKVGSDNEPVYVRLNSTIQLPSLMFTTGKRSAMAINIRERTAMQIDNMSPELTQMIFENFQYPPYQNKTFSMNNTRVDILSWLEVGLTYARVLYNDGQNFLKVGVTGKYLGGVASGYMNSSQINYSFNSDSTLSAQSSNVNYGHSSQFNLGLVNRKNYTPESAAFGYDIGLVYEFRGNIKAASSWEANEEGTPHFEERRDKNKYLFKIGLSYLNGGSLGFTKPDNVNNFSANIQNYDFKSVHAHTISEVDSAIATQVNFKNGSQNYSVGLPHALSAQIDLKLTKGFYLNFLGYFPLNNSETASNIQATRLFAITPRWENRWFGIYVPISFNQFHDTNLGAAIRLGPLYFGSANLGSVLFNDDLKAADFHLGIGIPVGFGKPSKVLSAFNRMKEAEQNHLQENYIPADTLLMKKIDSLQNELNALKQKPTKYKSPNIPISITINNYTGKDGEKKSEKINLDSLRSQDQLSPQQDTLHYEFNNMPANPSIELPPSDTTLYRLQLQSEQMMRQIELFQNQLQQQKVDTHINNLRQQQMNSMMQMMKEQNVRIQQMEDSIKKKS